MSAHRGKNNIDGAKFEFFGFFAVIFVVQG